MQETINQAETVYLDQNGKVITKAEYERIQSGDPMDAEAETKSAHAPKKENR